MKKNLLLLCAFLCTGFGLTAQTLFNETFEDGTLPAGWSISTKATDGGYKVGTAASLGSQYFPIPAHTGFVATNDDACNCDKSAEGLVSPVMDLTDYTDLTLTFDMFYVGETYDGKTESMFVDWSTDGGTTWTSTSIHNQKATVWKNGIVLDASALAGSSQAQLRFRYSDGGGWLYGAALDNITLFQPQPYDLRVISISPTNKEKCSFGAEEVIKMVVKNVGTESASGFDAKYVLTQTDGTEVEVVEPVFDVFDPGQTKTITFTTKADMSVLGDYKLVGEVLYGDDLAPEDNVISADMEYTSGEIVLSGTGSNYGDQFWTIYDSEGEVIATGGDWAKNTAFRDVVCVPADGCYSLTYETISGGPVTAANNNFKIEFNGKVVYIPTAVNDPAYVVPVHYPFTVYAMGNTCAKIDAGLSNVFIPPLMELNAPNYFEGEVFNYGADTLTSFDITYSIDGGDDQVKTFSNVNLAPSRSITFTHDKPVQFSSGVQKHTAELVVENFNGGEADADTTDNIASITFDVVEKLVTKRVVFEEATGTWCQWCPRGAVFLEKVTSENPETAIGIAVHNADPMTVTAWDAMMGQYIGGYPSGLADRRLNDIDPSQFPDALPVVLKYFPASASVETSAEYNVETKKLDITVSATMIVDDNRDLRLNAFIIEDDVTGTSSQYAQVNAYAGGANGPMGGYENLPNPVPASQMVYNHVGRAVLGTVWGSEGSVPAEQKRGDVYTKTYSYDVPAAWDYKEIKVVGVLQQWDANDIQNRGFINAAEVHPTIISSVVDPVLNASLSIYPNPASERVNLEFSLESAETMQIELTNIIGQVVYSDKTNYPTGTNRAWINTNQIANGTYFLKITGKNGIATRKVTVSH